MSKSGMSRREFLQAAGALGLVVTALGGSVLPAVWLMATSPRAARTLKIGMMTPRTGPVADKGRAGA